MPLLRLFLVALASVFGCLPAMAQQTKVGTIVTMQSGDTSCFVQLRDDAGKRFDDRADFEICTQRSLIGKRVTLTYKSAKVMAASCQGDVDCRKSDTVVLIVSARPTPLEAAKPTAPSPNATTHCVGAEKALFHCVTGSKAVSVCAAGGAKGYAQFRFGKLGEPAEVTLPEVKSPPAQSVTGQNRPFPQGGGQWLRFTRGAHSYVTYSAIGPWGPNGAVKDIAGIVVESNGKRTSNVKCLGKQTGILTPDMYEQLGIDPGRSDFDFPTED